MTRWCTTVWVGACLGTLAATAAAQIVEPRNSVAGQGTVTIECRAERLRVQIDVSGKHKDAKEAAKLFEATREAAIAKARELGAIPESIKVEEPRLGTGGMDDNAQMQQMVYMRMRGQKVDEKKSADLPVVISARLTAEWPLTGEKAVDLLLAAEELKKKIKDGDIAQVQKSAPPTPEEEEAAEESQNEYGPPPKQPGEPTFTFVATVSEASRAKATSEAFRKALTAAERLTAAAGVPLGKLQNLSASAGSVERSDPEMMAYQRYMGIGNNSSGDEDEGLAVGSNPARLQYRVWVNAAFGLGAP